MAQAGHQEINYGGIDTWKYQLEGNVGHEFYVCSKTGKDDLYALKSHRVHVLKIIFFKSRIMSHDENIIVVIGPYYCTINDILIHLSIKQMY